MTLPGGEDDAAASAGAGADGEGDGDAPGAPGSSPKATAGAAPIFGAFALASTSAGASGLGGSGGSELPFGTAGGGVSANPEIVAWLAEIGAGFDELAPSFAQAGISTIADLVERFKGLEKVRANPARNAASCLIHDIDTPLTLTPCPAHPATPPDHPHFRQADVDTALASEVDVKEPSQRITLRNRLLKL